MDTLKFRKSEKLKSIRRLIRISIFVIFALSAFQRFSVSAFAQKVAGIPPLPPPKKVKPHQTGRMPQIVTNVVYIATNVVYTNFYYTNLIIAQAGTLTPLTGNVIDPATGHRLVKTITATTGLTIVPFADTNWATVYLVNSNRYPVTWPDTNQVIYRGGIPPDPSEPYPSVLFESILGRIIATQ